MATRQWEMMCTPVGALTSALTVTSTPFMVKVACKLLTAYNSPSGANHHHESQRCTEVLVVVSPIAWIAW